MNQKIQSLTDMGFSPDQAKEALTMTNNDVEKAIGFLLGEVSEPNYASISKDDVPDIEELKHKQVTIYKSPSQSQEFGPVNQGNHGNDSYEQDTYHQENVPPSLPSRDRVSEYDDNWSRPISSQVSISEQSDSDSELALPPLKPRTEDEPIVILLPDSERFSNWIPILIQGLCQIDEVKYKLQRPLKSELGSKVKQIVDEMDNLNHNYTLNDILLANEDMLDYDEFISKIYEVINELYEDEYDDKFFQRLTKSKVQSLNDVENGDETEHGLELFQIDSDSKYSSLYHTFNEMFWGKNLETLGDIQFTKTADIITILYLGDYGDYNDKPIMLTDIFYPDYYSDKQTPKIIEKHEKFKQLDSYKKELANKSMKLTVFQGKKINNFMEQSKAFIQDDKILEALNNVSEKVAEGKSRINLELSELIKTQSETNVKNSKSYDFEGLSPYKLISVIINEFEYFHYLKKSDQWVHVNISKNLNIDQEFIPFEEVNSIVHQMSSQHTISPCLVYCKLEKLKESYSPTVEDKTAEANWELNEENNPKSDNDSSDGPPSADMEGVEATQEKNNLIDLS